MSYFRLLWLNYPTDDPCEAKNKEGEILFKNQCAIRLGYALKKTGANFSSFPSERKCWVHREQDHILSAKDLADWMDKGKVPWISKSRNVTGHDWRKKVLDKKGIICFEDYYAPSHGSGGDHIDLWDKDRLTGGLFFGWARARFNIVVPSRISDLRKAKRIRFFPVA